MTKIVFGTSLSKPLKYSKSVNSFGPPVFSASEIYLSLSIRVVNSKNEFAAAENRMIMGVTHVTTNF